MIRVQVYFSRKIRLWDGFGVNYVEAAQTRDYGADPRIMAASVLFPRLIGSRYSI